MLDELEQVDPTLIKKLEDKLSQLKKRINEMKWQMHKIVLLAIIVSTVFFSMLVYYVTYPFLFKIRRSFFQIFACFS